MGKAKDIKRGIDIRRALISGLNQVSDTVKATLGPKGRLVLIGRNFSSAHLTKDGVSVAREISLKDPYENEGAKLCIDVASKANHEAGDGTSTATVLAQAIVNEGIKAVESGIDPVSIKRGLDSGVKETVDYINSIKRDISVDDGDDVEYIGTIAGNDIEVGKFVAQAWKNVGAKGVIALEPWKKSYTEVFNQSGYSFDSGYISPYFVTDQQKMRVSYEDTTVRVLVTDIRIKSAEDIIPFMEDYLQCFGGDPLLIVGDDVEGDALPTLVLNSIQGKLRSVAVKGPGFGERRKGMLQDLAMLLGATFVTESKGHSLKNLSAAKVCGVASFVLVTSDSTTIIAKEPDEEAEKAARNEKIQAYIDGLLDQAKESDSSFDIEKLKERAAKLSSGISIIKVGATTEAELKEKKDRYEDAISATKAAIETGIVPGGGVVLLAASKMLSANKTESTSGEFVGREILAKALKHPFCAICENAVVEYQGWMSNFLSETTLPTKAKDFKGIDARTGKEVNMLSSGIIDPVKVVVKALESANSIAGMILLTEAGIVDAPENDTKD